MEKESPLKGKIISSYVNEIFPLQDFKDRYIPKKIIGKGTYGYVAKAINKLTGQYVAIKKIVSLFESLPETRRILREIILLKNCKHPNIVSMIECILPRDQNIHNFDKIYLITEFCDSDLQKVFRSDNIFFQAQDVQLIMYQILCGLKYLHQASIIHRDLKPANVLINGQGLKIKICDFGLARVIQEINEKPPQDESSSEDEKQVQTIMSGKKNPQSTNSIKTEVTSTNNTTDKKKKPPARGYTKKIQVQTEDNSQQFKIKKEQTISNPSVKLTLRVTTRWYRAPEVILLEKGYNKPIDVWSAGCIFGELLKMQKNVCADSLHRFPLFPGKYCYPVSPNTLGIVNKNGYPQGRNDQLNMIISTIGKPSEQEMSFLTDENAKDYLCKVQATKRRKFREIFPSMSLEATKILENALKFDPRKRITVQEALQSPYFSDIRMKDKQSTCNSIFMPFDMNEENLTLENLKQYFRKELKEYF